MTPFKSALFATVSSCVLLAATAAWSDTNASRGTSVPAKSQPSLQPAEGARVTLIAPPPGAVFASHEVPLHFTLVKGKRGEHVHAYVDGELMGMFKSERGTLTGITPGKHVLELRVAAEDHRTELDAIDRVEFTVIE